MMRVSEQELRAALDGAVSADYTFLRMLLAKFEYLRFLHDDPGFHCATLRARELAGTRTGSIAIHYSPGGRALKVVAVFCDHASSTVTYRLPRKYWPATHRRERFTKDDIKND
jgi:hypothetical protein